MRQMLLVSVRLAAVAYVVSTVIGAQAPATSPKPETSSWKAPRVAGNQPDLQGVWDFRTVTPMERPSEFGDKQVLSDEEAADYERERVEASNVDNIRNREVGGGLVNGGRGSQDVALAYNDIWYDRGTKVVGTKRTSLVIDPSDGRIPELTPEAKQRLADQQVARERPARGPEDRSVGERCILGFNSGPPVVPGGYNQNLQIFQSADHVVVLNEMVHNARIIPLDGRDHGRIPQWSGVSRGRWEGDTLVVETRNFSSVTAFRGSSPSLQLTERFTRVADDTLVYEFTVNDAKTWTRPWTAQIPMRKSDLPLYEYACHEGNYGMEGILSSARAVERSGGGAPARKR